MIRKNKIAPVQYFFSTVVGVITLSLLFFLGYHLSLTNHHIITISMLAVTGGLIFESLRISDKWINVLYILLAAFICSFFVFLPRRNETNYIFENHLSQWPYWFIGIFMLISTIANSRKTTSAISEGIILIQSLAIIYWIIEHKFYLVEHWSLRTLLILVLLFCTFNIFTAVTRFQLSRTTRLWVSIWSCVIVLIFSVDNILRVSFYPPIENIWDIYEGFYIGIEYFFLGISAMYIVQNFLMLMEFLPGKGAFFNGRYFRELKELKARHIERYSEEQVYLGHAMICIIATSTWYGINYTFKFLPSNTAIWIGFVIFPLLLRLFK